MQNLQIYYSENSPHIEYLEQFNLLDEQEVQHHFDQANSYEQIQNFDFIQKEQQQQQQTVSYHEWIVNLLYTQKQYQGNKLSQIVVCLIQFVFGDIFQFAYLLSNMKQTNAIQQIKKVKWQIVLRLLIVFILSVNYPFIVLTLAYLVSNQMSLNEIKTEIDCSQRFKKQLTFAANQMKFMFIEQFRSFPDLRKQLFICLDDLLTFVSRTLKIERIFSDYIVDELDEIIFKINERKKLNNFGERFIAQASWINRKIIYWKLCRQNNQMAELINHFQSTRILYETRKKDHLSQTKQDIIFNSNLYYQILISQLAKLDKNRDEKSITIKKKLLTILKKQIELKQMFRVKYQNQNEQQQISMEPEDKEKENAILFQEQQVNHYRYMCYKDEGVSQYIPSNPAAIKQQLQEMLKRHQRSEEEEQSKSQSQQSQIKSISSQQSESKQERLSFGFAIPPPARDMSSYYIV